eukprot:jgi/Ulvmu1/12242/UM086_0033.1
MSSHVSRNVLACKLLKCSQALARGLWNNGILSPYLLILTGGSKTAVGLVQGLFGLSTAAIALPVGVLSDRTARHIVAKLSALLDLAAMISTSAGILASHGQYHLLCAAGVFWGMSTACDSNTDALFADSVPTGQRSAEFTQLQALSLACLGAGPLIAAAIFHQQGNDWTLHQLGIVIMCGMAASIVPVFLKLLVHDKYTLGAESDAYVRPSPPSRAAAAAARPAGSHASAVAAVAADVDAHAPNDLVDVKDTATTHFAARSHSAGRRRPSLPAIRSGAELRFSASGDVLPDADAIACTAPEAAGGTSAGDAGPPDRRTFADIVRSPKSGQNGASAAIPPTSSVAKDAISAGGGDCSTDAREHSVRGWLQGVATAVPSGSPRSPFLAASHHGSTHADDVREPLLRAAELSTDAAEHEVVSGQLPMPWAWWPEGLVLEPEWVPSMVFSADLMSGLASGMTIKFFPIFFMDEALLSPMVNSLLFACTPLGIAAAMFLAHRLSLRVGRVPAILTMRWAGVALLLLMAAAPGLWPVPAAILPIYLARTACANASTALARSILMDFVPKDRRGRWSSLDGVTIFGWSGSAMLGGYLLDRCGFSAVFAVTAAMQFSGSLLLASLLPVVPRHEAAAAAAAAAIPCVASSPRGSVGGHKAGVSVARRSASTSSGHSVAGARSIPCADDAQPSSRWDQTLQPQWLSIDGEEEIAQSFSSSFSGV